MKSHILSNNDDKTFFINMKRCPKSGTITATSQNREILTLVFEITPRFSELPFLYYCRIIPVAYAGVRDEIETHWENLGQLSAVQT